VLAYLRIRGTLRAEERNELDIKTTIEFQATMRTILHVHSAKDDQPIKLFWMMAFLPAFAELGGIKMAIL